MADAVTISLLPIPLALIHIPRSRLQALSHPVLRHILHPSPTFFNVTANEIEISLFVDYQHVQDFEVIAEKDKRSQHKNPVEISYEPWSVLQIDSHTDQLDNSGARVNELSAPLAAAGISILYQSSYLSDFIFVKQSRLHEALTLFEKAGFDLYNSNSVYSPAMSPESPLSASGDYMSNVSSPTVLTRSHSTILSSTHSSTPTSCATPNGDSFRERIKSHSPTSGEVRILNPDFACVGLSDEFGVDHWGLKIVKLVAFPELIHSSSPSPLSSSLGGEQSILFSSKHEDGCDDADDDGYFSHSPHSISTSEISAMSTPHIEPSSEMWSRTRSAAGATLSPIDTTITTISGRGHSATASAHDEEEKEEASSPSPSLRIPFFSFTRTLEGSSLTADVKTLAALFPPEERHLLVCCRDLDSNSDLDEGCGFGSDDEEGNEEEDDGGDMSMGDLKCLQIDLKRFGLDKFGLVNRFSRVLGENGVNHMYSSTFKTANLLVNKKHAIRARTLLRRC